MQLSADAQDAGWVKKRAPITGLVYFNNVRTGLSRWTPPSLALPAPSTREASHATHAPSSSGDDGHRHRAALHDASGEHVEVASGVHGSVSDDAETCLRHHSRHTDDLPSDHRPALAKRLPCSLPPPQGPDSTQLGCSVIPMAALTNGSSASSHSSHASVWVADIDGEKRRVSDASSSGMRQRKAEHLSTPRLLERLYHESHAESMSRILHSRGTLVPGIQEVPELVKEESADQGMAASRSSARHGGAAGHCPTNTHDCLCTQL
jgi:hypothetical protein